MKRYAVCLIGLGALVTVAAVALAALGTHASSARVYSVAAARLSLARAPQLWVGRTLLVYGRLDGCLPAPAACPVWQPRLFDPAHASAREALPVEQVPPGSWLTALRRLPLLDAIIPAPRPAPWGAVGIYQVQLQAYPVSTCRGLLCPSGGDLATLSCDTRTCYRGIVLERRP